MPRSPIRPIVVLATWAIAAMAVAAEAQTAGNPLAQLQFDIVGVKLVVDPPALTVPKNIATQINTNLALPPGVGSEAREAIESLTNGAVIEAELRGPELQPTRIVTRPGQPIPIPPLAIPGDYFLDSIRLVKNGQTILDATAPDGRLATTIPIRVISEVFVTNVTSRPLSLDEIRGRGIVIDQNNFRAVSFQVAFNVDGVPFTIDVPAALPTPEFLQQKPSRADIVQQLTAINTRLRGTDTKLPPQFDRPGLNFSIAALPFFPVPDDDGGIPDLDIPPITGLVVIPGNVAFLNQFFSVLLMVTNVAPDGTPLELRDASAAIVLPPGLDRVPGSFEQPGDDPLRLARIEGAGIQSTVPVIQLGADGLRNTADDVAVIPPQRSGEAEFLVEGLKEGSHLFDLEITATLFGLPSGPVRLSGQAAGAVFVRNPTFSVTLAHPRTIRSGEEYDLYATVTNTSESAANLVGVGLASGAISGALLLSDPTVTFETLGPGQSVTARFRLLAQKTGQVTFSSFTGEASNGGGIQLTTGIDERGVTLAPNAIVLPKATDHLPQSLVTAAQRVLGQAFSIATAPAEALPAGVLFVKRQTVIDRATELAEAGERVGFGDSMTRAVQDLLLDWLGNATFDAGFDQILRTTDAGAAMLAEIAAIVQVDATGANVLDYQDQFAQTTVARPGHLSAVVGAAAGVPSPLLTIDSAAGGSIGQSPGGYQRSLVSGAALELASSAGDSRLAVVGVPQLDRYTAQIVARAAGTYDLGVVVPGTATSQPLQLRYTGVALDAGGSARVEIDLHQIGSPLLSVDRNGDGLAESQIAGQLITIADHAPSLVTVRQLASAYRETAGDIEDPATYGLVVGVLFDKPVTVATAELKTNYAVEANGVIGVRLQPSGRVAYLYLERPIGSLVSRTLTVAGVEDAGGRPMPPTVRPIDAALSDGAHVFGQVRTADNLGVPQSVLKLTVSFGSFAFVVSTVRTDANGGFDFDFVPRLGTLVLEAQHPTTLEIASLSARIRGQGEQLLLSPTFQGRGTVRGRVLAADGLTTVPGTRVALLPGSVLGSRGFETVANALGEYTFSNVPVGVFTITGIDDQGGLGQTTGVLPSSSAIATLDLVLTSRADEGGRVVGRVFLSDGTTPGAAFTVFVGTYNRDSAQIQALDRTTTDATGTFAFSRSLPAGAYDVVAVDGATEQLGIARVDVAARQTASINVVLEAVGAVEGVVFNARGEPQPGALVAGGAALVETDANGFFRLQDVPAGRRSIEAGDPVTKRRGSATINVLPGQTVTAAVTLEARATIIGRVLDAAGAPIPGATVRLPQVGGYQFVFANDSGVFRFPDMPLGEYLIQAPGPSRESLIDFMEQNGYDPRSAFTSGDVPSTIGEPSTPSFSDRNAVLAAYQDAVRTFLSVDETLLTGLPMADLGGFGWTKVQLFQDATTISSDVRFLPQGTVSGRTEDSSGQPIGALTRVTGLGVSQTGFPTLVELGRKTTDAASGTFSFGGIAHFDLGTFQRTGIRSGDFTLEAAHPFSPVIAQFRGQLTPSTPALSNVALRFPSASETNGTIRGRVLLPGGAPAPPNTQVQINFGDLTLVTGENGAFESPLPIPAATYTISATAPTGLRGQATGVVPAGGTLDVTVQLLGLGATTVVVRRPDGQPVPGALISLERGSFPGDRLDGTADANGQLRFANVTEGSFSVSAEEPITGLAGRTSAVILRDADLPLTVTITASGSVSGRFLSADGTSPIPFAQVVLRTGAVQAFATTDVQGRFELHAIPVGSFQIEALDPQTGRIGRAADTLVFERQHLDVTLLQIARGVVSGTVVLADGTSPVPGANVRIQSGVISTDLQATARPDGSFRFEGIPQGEFTLTAKDLIGGFTGSVKGTISFENEVVDRTVALEPFGSIVVTTLDVAGAPATNASVTLSRGQDSRTAAVDSDGHATFEFLPLGTYSVVGRSLSNPGDGGHATAELSEGGQRLELSVPFRGTGTVNVIVVGADGVTRIPSARVTLQASAAPAAATPGPLASTATAFTNSTGTAAFPNAPVGAFFVIGEAAALAGVSNGDISSPGQTVETTVRLGASGSVIGRVLLPDGTTPAAQAIVTLRFTPQSSLQTGVLQVTTGVSGTFSFSGVPIGGFTLSAFEVVSSGVRTRSDTLVTNGQQRDLGDVVLDNAAPRVVSTSPGDRVAGAPRQTSISVTFSEAMRQSSFTPAGPIALMDGAAAVPIQALAFSADGRTVSFTPVQPLRSSATYTLIVRGGPDGPRDEAADLPLVDSQVTTFTTADDVPPVIVGVSPAAGERQVLPGAAVRVAFSEAIATGTLTLSTGAGTAVAGQSVLTAGHAAIAFTPLDVLRPNTSYIATLTGVTDTAGNSLPGGGLTFNFTTIDTIPPQITGLQITGTPRAGATITLTPVMNDVSSADARRVEYLIGSAAPVTVAAAPFAITTTVPSGAAAIAVHATAVDEFGNRSAAFSETLSIQPNTPPQVVLRTVAPLTSVVQGQSIEFEAVATDDEQLARVALSAVGAATFSEVRSIPAGQTTFTTRFVVQVPSTAASNSVLTVQAAAVDVADATGEVATVTLPIADGARPTITVLSPVNNAQMFAGQTLSVIADVTDDVGVASVTLTCTPALAGCDTRTIQPAVSSTRQTFAVVIPSDAAAGSSIVILLTARDAAGNATQIGRTIFVPDTLPPAINALDPVSGSTRVVAGETAAIRASFADNIGVSALLFQTEGGVAINGSVAVAPPRASGDGVVSFLVPAATANGSAITVHVQARDAALNTSVDRTIVLTVGDSAAPAVSILSPAAGALAVPGQPVAVSVRATDDTAVERVVLTASGVFTTVDTRVVSPPVVSTDVTFGFTVPVGTAGGEILLSVEAFDTAGHSSGSVTRALTVPDTILPTVRIVSPAAGAEIDPRSALSVTVEANDAGGVNQIGLAVSGVAASVQTRAVAPPALVRSETFIVPFDALPVAGGTLSLNASARDAAGNTGTASGITIRVLDVVAPVVTTVSPANGATDIDPATPVVVTFSEPMSGVSLTSANVRLTAGITEVPATLAIGTDNRTVTLTPTAPLAVNTVFTVTAAAALADASGLQLGAPFVSTFRTSTPDSTAPRVESIDPANNATGVPTTSPITVTFTEAIAAGSISTSSFRVIAGGTPVNGTFTFTNAGRTVRFTPAAPWPLQAVIVTELHGSITDLANNGLASDTGQPLTTPLTFTFLTGDFSITSPAASTVVENTRLTLSAEASAALSVANVIFTVNGSALPPVASPFSTVFNVPSAGAASTLTIVASARNAQAVEVARAEKVVAVVDGLTVSPSLAGLPRGAVRPLRLSLAHPASEDIAIDLSVVDPQVAAIAPTRLVLPAGQTSAAVDVTACTICPWDPVAAGRAAGNTSVIATSPRGTVVATVSVSDPVAGQQLTSMAAPTGASVSLPPAAGHAFTAAGRSSTITVLLLREPLSGTDPLIVSVFSSNPAVAMATATAIQPGQQTAAVTIDALANGIVTLTLRAGSEVRSFTVFVGPIAAEATPLVLAAPTGLSISQPPSAGQIVSGAGKTSTITVQMLSSVHSGGSPLTVTVSTSNPAIATATAASIQPGSQTTTVTVTTGAEGVATLTLRAGDVVRSITVVVGTPAGNVTPIVVAQPVAASIPPLPFIGAASAASGSSFTLGVLLLAVPASGATAVTVTSSDPAIVQVNGTATIAAGSRMAVMSLTTAGTGRATLTLEVDGLRREFAVFVGSLPSPGTTPVITAPPIGASVVPQPDLGRVLIAPGAPVAATLGVTLLSAVRTAPTPVTITSSDPSIAGLATGSTLSTEIAAGTTVVPLDLTTSGTQGAALLRFEFDGTVRELLVIVGDPPPDARPAVTAPVVGVRIQ